MKMRIFIAILGVLLISIGPACKKKSIQIDPEIASSDEALFRTGEQFVKKDPEKARLYLRQVIDSFPKSFYAQRAKLAIADSYFYQGDEASMILAASEYRDFITNFPLSPSAPYAQLQIALSFFKKTLKPGRDQTKTEQALIEFKRLITDYPLSDETKEAREKVKICEEYLAAHTLSIGKLYFKRRAYPASVNRLKDILSNYPTFSGLDEVFFVLGESYYKMAQTEESVPYYTKLISDYPQSKFAKKAQERMKEIEK
ncbi:MAG: outer membrane protein assembly factor BamD [Candidatus Aminicenantes bacterium]|nr:MAG: outer membrane protein assembly factor BamD [Candidatus Aminicenantes bacterium]